MDIDPQFTGKRLLNLALSIEVAVAQHEAGATPLGRKVIEIAEAAVAADKIASALRGG